MSSNRGVTLVELAIVIAIIGLLIGGILKGQEMIMQARVVATIKQYHEMNAAITSFVDKYHQPPGDMATARTRLNRCDDSTNCQNGNGDSQFIDITGVPVHSVWVIDESGLNTESTQLWKHLALADFISGVIIDADTTAWGISHPAAPIGGGWQIATLPAHPSWRGFSATTFYRLQNPSQGTPVPGIDQMAISPFHLWVMDTKTDDGNPDSGYVWGSNPVEPSLCDTADGYRIQLRDKTCLAFFGWK